MNLPIKFPSDTDVILEEVTKFRRSRRESASGPSRVFWPTARS